MRHINGFLLGVLIVLVVLPLIGCATVGKVSATSEEEVAVANVLKAWDKAYDAADIASLANLLTDDAVLESNRLGGRVDKKQYLSQTESMLRREQTDMKGTRQYGPDDLEINVLGNRAEVVKKFTIMNQGPDSRRPWYGHLVTETKLRRESGVWKIYFQKTSRTN